ncbi:hypothetical protein [Runella sp.]|uniref:hypothetical protein n=1 Tax=Runella sp. TaxID=1960881 RepID=UPI003017162C
MKYVEKGIEPDSLRALRNTEGASYSGPQEDWQEALLEEQGWICAYCLGRISLERSKSKGVAPKMQIEHYLPREKHPEKALQWRNMLGVCLGNHGIKPHCDKTEGGKNEAGTYIKGKIHGDVVLQKLDPLAKNVEALLTYSSSGEIKSVNSDPETDADLNFRLNLNDEKLIQYRKDVIDLAKSRLEKKYPDRRWNQSMFDKEIEQWSARKEDKHIPYFRAAVWFLNWLKNKPVYQK